MVAIFILEVTKEILFKHSNYSLFNAVDYILRYVKSVKAKQGILMM